MKDLRSELRSAFDKEQAASPPASDLRRSIVAATVDRPQRASNLQLVAAAAALLITALVILSLLASRVALRSQAPAHSTPSPSATAANGDYGPPPAGVPLFYLKDPQHQGWFVGFDWSGTPRATLKLPTSDPSMSLAQSADGSFFIYRPGAKGGGGQFYDRLGKPVTGNGGFAGAVWADDNSHQCGMAVDESAGKWNLATQTPGQPARTVTTVAPYSPGDQAALQLLACSFRNDRAVVERIANSYPTDLWVIQLSNGTVLTHQSYSDGAQYAGLVSSWDGSLLATSSSTSEGYIGGPSAPTTTVVRFSDGATLMKVDPSIAILGFSADNKKVLVMIGPWLTGQPMHLAVMDVQSGQIVWRYEGNQLFAGFFTNPAGSGFAVMLERSTTPGAHPVVDVVLVGADGRAITLPSGYLRP